MNRTPTIDIAVRHSPEVVAAAISSFPLTYRQVAKIYLELRKEDNEDNSELTLSDVMYYHTRSDDIMELFATLQKEHAERVLLSLADL